MAEDHVKVGSSVQIRNDGVLIDCSKVVIERMLSVVYNCLSSFQVFNLHCAPFCAHCDVCLFCWLPVSAQLIWESCSMQSAYHDWIGTWLTACTGCRCGSCVAGTPTEGTLRSSTMPQWGQRHGSSLMRLTPCLK